MKMMRFKGRSAGTCLWLVLLAGWLAQAPGLGAATEETFDTLQIGAQTYRNVTVTSKTTNNVFVLYSGGMTSFKVTELPPEVRAKLGYVDPPKPAPPTNAAKAWANETLTKLNTPEVKRMKSEITKALDSEQVARARQFANSASLTMIFSAMGVMFLSYLFFCFCCMLICQKAGKPPGFLVWLPVLKVFPLLRAAGMSGWWFLALFVPFLNVVAGIMWCFKIAKARDRGILTGIFLLLPITNFFAFLYLAFASDEPAEAGGRSRVMVLSSTGPVG